MVGARMTRKFVYGADELHFLGLGRLYGFIIISLAPTIAAKMPRYAFCLEKMGKKALSYYTFTTAPRCEWEHQQPNFVRGKQANLVPLAEPFYMKEIKGYYTLSPGNS